MARDARSWSRSGCSPEHGSAGERYAHALTHLSDALWQSGRGFGDMLALICEVAAQTLDVRRVNAWRYDPAAHRLHCLHVYDALAPVAAIEPSLRLTPEYESALHELRAIDLCEVRPDDDSAAGDGLAAYLRRHRITALLDAPVCVDGAQMGVLCHEHVGGRREWTSEERAFAASMGDFASLAYQIARRRRAERELVHLRLHDPATDLPNREFMLDVLGQRLRDDAGCAVIHVHIARDAQACDAAGVASHDALVLQAAGLLRAAADDRLLLARVQPDGFAVLPPRGLREAQALAAAQRCLGRLEDIASAAGPQAFGVGVAFAAPGETDPAHLLLQAEEAATHAREVDGRYEVFDLERHEALLERVRTEHALRAAFADDRLELHYQPEYDIARGRWSGAEALLRWRDGERVRPASDFMEVAEACNLVLRVGRWAMERACRDAAGWRMPVPVRVNVSSRQFEAGTLVDQVRAVLDETGLPAERLCLEITETTLMHDVEAALVQLDELRTLGVEVAVDDFGTGYSSLAYLKRLPVSTLKIDRSFVSGLPEDRTDEAIVSTIVALANAMGLDIVAEGVETAEQERILAAHGVRRVQGWLHGRAMAASALDRLFQSASDAAAQRVAT